MKYRRLCELARCQTVTSYVPQNKVFQRKLIRGNRLGISYPTNHSSVQEIRHYASTTITAQITKAVTVLGYAWLVTKSCNKQKAL